METLVIALGGNALLKRGAVLSAENQYQSIALIADAIGKLAKKYRIAIVHGNGPQVGLLALQNLAYRDVPPYPLDILVAESQGMIGYMLAQQLGAFHPAQPVSTLLTRVLVDSEDPAYREPSKFIGPVYEPQQQAELEKKYGWSMKLDGKYLRRVVPSPEPKKIIDIEAINLLLAKNHIVICNGGGGVPMVASAQGMIGSEAVIDKDLASALLAEALDADHLVILTDADAVYQHWGTPQQKAIRSATTKELAPMAVADGSMGPKIMAVSRFVQRSGKVAHIGALQDIESVLAGTAGTLITP
ncbi:MULTISPECIES: carbamate kinase [Serratia]|jgi:carbamate kinase|uniref:Carbamate kinase n=1 Tax=Serratia fonticola TaxID=47917 RepID=A0AAE7EJU0_SERFO|nr:MULTISPECIES: carbamate kinase [Serratia]ATM74983.1 carbamate kinase [Serratia fonticola]MBC3226988.1 carbamate kinase [Serratia fonticola]MBE0149148.1 carbamate kinase [Serratia fonticola]MCO7510689.1 carbamate kinase [Serratia fonticola]MDQ7208561.1 carbamate kinase [Serratia fonticola]